MCGSSLSVHCSNCLHTTRRFISGNFPAVKTKAFRVFHIGGGQGKTSAGEDERNIRIFEHAYSILNNKPLQLLADFTGFSPNGALLCSQLCIGKDHVALVFDGQFHIISANLKEMLSGNLEKSWMQFIPPFSIKKC